jgi:hypothetical protein
MSVCNPAGRAANEAWAGRTEGRRRDEESAMLVKAWSEPWLDWRRHVVALIRVDFREVLQDVGEDDIDWDAWRPLYEAGRSPKAAVDSAFLRAP